MNQLSIFDDYVSTAEAFIADLESFADFGQPTARETVDEIPYLINEFWTAGQRQSHSIHEVSYRACFKAQLPEVFYQPSDKAGRRGFRPVHGTRDNACSGCAYWAGKHSEMTSTRCRSF
ncbi:MAG: hypothetical protein U5K36_14965 [Roseovarius sp.]|nr:hypothetical protein [Roseovarius sp.]